MKVRDLINYLEKIPVDQQELLDMELRLKVPCASGVVTQWVGVKTAALVTDERKHKTSVELVTTYSL